MYTVHVYNHAFISKCLAQIIKSKKENGKYLMKLLNFIDEIYKIIMTSRIEAVKQIIKRRC